MKKLIIDRSKWRTGNNCPHATGKGDPCLLNDEGFLDAIGFELLRRGLTEKQILNQASVLALPGALAYTIADCPDGWLGAIMHLNDGRLLQAEKEEQIKALFINIGVEVEFTGTYIPYNS